MKFKNFKAGIRIAKITSLSSLRSVCRKCERSQRRRRKLEATRFFLVGMRTAEAAIFGTNYWIFPTYSARYEEQTFFDAFSSPDLIHSTKHARVLDTNAVTWAHRAMWAPSVVEKEGKYYFFFGANDIQNNEQRGGIGVAVADRPEGSYKDLLGKPLLNHFEHGAQPIDQFAFHDPSGQYYLIYGGWRHCDIAKLKPDFTGFEAGSDGEIFKEITPEGYVEGPYMLVRNGKYYLMWSEGGWTGSGPIQFTNSPPKARV